MFKKYFSLLNYHSKRLISLQKANEFDWMKQEQLLMEPFEYVQKLPCKHHTLMAPAFNHWLQVQEDKLDGIQKACRAWITWGTLLDDIQDDSQFRHGVPAAHHVFGVGATINAAGKTLIRVQKQIADLGHPLGPKIILDRTDQVLYSEGIDIYWRDNCVCPTEEAYVEITKGKTGAYFVLPVELMQLFSNNRTDFTKLANRVGSYYEMLDDYYNLFHPKALGRLAEKAQVTIVMIVSLTENHVTNSDITEGKITLAIIHALQFPDVATELVDILKQRTSDPKLQNRAIVLLRKHGSDEYTRNKMRKLEAEIREEIDQHGGNPMLTVFMDDLSFQSHEPAPELELY